jgi:IS5 family transposase
MARAGGELWVGRHEERLREGVAKILAWQEKVRGNRLAKVEHPFRAIKRQFAYTKVHYRDLAKITARVLTLFALFNLWMVRRQLLPA